MTGFGVATSGGIRVEARSVNARFLEVKIRQPFGAAGESRLRARVKGRLGRGRVDVFVAFDPDAAAAEGGEAGPTWLPALRALLSELDLVRREGERSGVELSMPNALEVLDFSRRKSGHEAASAGDDELPAGCVEAFDGALDALIEMRRKEGEALHRVLVGQLDALQAVIARVGTSLAGEGERLLAMRREGLAKLLGEAGENALRPDDPALLKEVALLVQRGDVREELDRLESHFAQLRELLAAKPKAGQGKRLDFLVQELLREVGTLGAKTTAHEASAELIEAKSIIEAMREQVQNVE